MTYNMTTYKNHHLFAYSSSPFSQWFAHQFDAFIGDTEYTFANAEQYMMASKAHLFEDQSTFAKIMKTDDPKKMKALGRTITGFDQNVWDQYKEDIVFNGTMAKFAEPVMRKKLLDTNDLILVEAAPWDSIWGVGIDAATCKKYIDSGIPFPGLNLLGQALMRARSKYTD